MKKPESAKKCKDVTTAAELPALEDVKGLGGDEADYQLVQFQDGDDVESVELNEESSDSEALKNEVEAFINKLGFKNKRKDRDESDETPTKNAKKLKNKESEETTHQQNVKALTKSNTRTSSNTSEQPDSKARSNLEIANSKQPNGDKKGKATVQAVEKARKSADFSVKSRKYLLIKGGNWIDNQFIDSDVVSQTLPKESLEKLEEFAKQLLEDETSLFRSQLDRKKSSAWMNKVLTSGTAADKMAALVVRVQDSPVHNLSCLDSLISMLKMKERRKSLVVIDSLKKLFLTSLLPDRKLNLFSQQPLSHVMELASGNKDTQDKRLLMWYFESQLKQKYDNFIKAVEILSHDTVETVKNKAIGTIFELLCEKPEQEKVLLSMLVNKLGDPVRKMAARTAHLLSKLVEKHPKMKQIVTLEVERLLYRSNITPKAQYYAICFLNGLRLGESDSELASRLVLIYFSFFKTYVTKGEIDSKMLSGLLVGVNRAYPFAKVDQQKIADQQETLFRLIHVSNFATCVQALILLFQIIDINENSADRFYTALYRKMNDPELPTSAKLPMFLNLLLKGMKKDSLVSRIQAFVKRLLQVAMSFSPSFACSALLVLSELLKERPKLLILNKLGEDFNDGDDGDEHFEDVKVEDESDDETKVTHNTTADDCGDDGNDDDKDSSVEITASLPSWIHRKNLLAAKESYDPLHRNPLYCRADKDCVWELRNLAHHYHPSVRVFATTILKGETVNYASNPLEDFSLQRFLDRFVTRNPKKNSDDNDEDEEQLDEDEDDKDGGDSDEEADDDDSDVDDAFEKFEAFADEDD